MANKAGMGMVLAGGAALVILGSGKKRKKSSARRDSSSGYDPDYQKSGSASQSGTNNISANPKTTEIQEVLHALGYGNLVGTIDGRSGPKTRSAIGQFQQDYNMWPERRRVLRVDEKWGPNSSDAAEHALYESSVRGTIFTSLIQGGGSVPDPSEGGSSSSSESPLKNILPPSSPQRPITISEDGNKYDMNIMYRMSVIEPFLARAKNEHRLLTNSDKQTWGKFFYDTFIRDPSTWIGEVTGAGPNGGAAIYAGLWIIATAGAGLVAAGGAGAAGGATAATATKVTSSAAYVSSGAAVKSGMAWSTTNAMMATGWIGVESLVGSINPQEYYSKTTLGIISGSLLDLAGYNKIPESAYKPIVDDLAKKFPLWKEHPDLAASAMETLFEFLGSHYAYVGERGQKILLSRLPPAQVPMAIYNIILGRIYVFQRSN